MNFIRKLLHEFVYTQQAKNFKPNNPDKDQFLGRHHVIETPILRFALATLHTKSWSPKLCKLDETFGNQLAKGVVKLDEAIKGNSVLSWVLATDKAIEETYSQNFVDPGVVEAVIDAEGYKERNAFNSELRRQIDEALFNPTPQPLPKENIYSRWNELGVGKNVIRREDKIAVLLAKAREDEPKLTDLQESAKSVVDGFHAKTGKED